VWGVSDERSLPGGVRLPLRATLIRLPDGGLWMHSPVPFDRATADAIDALGPVRSIVAGNLQHHVSFGPAVARWPAARTFAPAGLRSKCPTLRIDADLDARPPDAWQGVFAVVPVLGAPLLDEFVFVHHPSRTLICTDLVFHIRRPANLATRLLLQVVGADGRLAASRSWRWVFAKDRAAVGRSVVGVFEHPFDRIVPCHGDVVTQDGRAALAEATEFLRAWAR
jgi:hypothetical protein